eukprot:4269841-Pleurochrysis_carterae.AAC.2
MATGSLADAIVGVNLDVERSFSCVCAVEYCAERRSASEQTVTSRKIYSGSAAVSACGASRRAP